MAEGVTSLVLRLLEDYPHRLELDTLAEAEPLTWEIEGRLLVLGPLVYGLIEFGLVLLVAVLVMRRRRAA